MEPTRLGHSGEMRSHLAGWAPTLGFVVLVGCGSGPPVAAGGTPPSSEDAGSNADADARARSADTGAPEDAAAREAAPIDASEAGPAAHVMMGAYTDQDDAQPMAFADLEAAVGRGLAIENQREVWDTDFAQADEQADIKAGVIPMISWTLEKPHGKCATLQEIAAGTYDDQIKTEATIVAGLGVRVLIRFYKEFTDSQIDACAYGTAHPSQDPTVNGPLLVGAWQHVVTLFRASGANNVEWIWGPSAALFTGMGGAADPTTWTYFYPGDGYVDWIANDNYNKKPIAMDYSADLDIQNWYGQVAGRGKPLMQSETGAAYDSTLSPDPQTAWVKSAYEALPTKYPAIRAWVYWSAKGQEDYRLQGAGLAAFKTMVQDPYFEATH
jgi:hypothetical protein